MAKVNNDLNNVFSSLDATFKEETNYDFFDYPTRLKPADIGGDEYYNGRPVLGEVREQEFTDEKTGNTTKRIMCAFWLVDDEEQEYLEINLNPKMNSDLQKNIHSKSMLYKLLAGVMETIQPGWSQENNFIKQFDLSEIREYLSNKNSMTILLREESFMNNRGEQVTFYPFKVTEIN